jgi:TolA-binding protein
VQLAHVQLATEEEAQAVRRRLERGEPIEEVVRRFTTDDLTRNNGGFLGNVTATSNVAHLGRVPDINAIALRMQKGEVGGPVRLPGDRGWSVICATDRWEEEPRNLDGALEETIRQKLQTQKHNQIYRSLLSELRAEYGHKFYEENYARYEASLLTDEQIFTKATRAKTPEEKIRSYRQILDVHSDSPYAGQARFMIGFVLADEQKEYELARDEFNTFLEQYPDHELAESARWMLENMDQPNPDPEQLKQVRRKATAR